MGVIGLYHASYPGYPAERLLHWRWRMLIVFAFFSVISMLLVASFSVALLNVIIRR
jgi:hypothetical protein